MNHYLLDRFRGCLLGTIIVSQINNERTCLENWEIINQKIMSNLTYNETISIETAQEINFNDAPVNSGELILEILPLILFFYETEILLFEELEKIKQNTKITEQNIEDVMLFRQIINLIFKQENNLLEKISNLSQSLEKLHIFLNSQTLLTELKEQFRQKSILDSNDLLLSLYCFGRTPDSFKLSILQASQFKHPLILRITAVLSGAYNGYSNIPIPWRLSLSSEEKISLKDEQIIQLWAKWKGVDDPLKNSFYSPSPV
ncbi:MAG: ADP-ribosylglycohydrolase family protein [Crocosphaera sp.]